MGGKEMKGMERRNKELGKRGEQKKLRARKKRRN